MFKHSLFRLIWCGLGASVGLGLALWLVRTIPWGLSGALPGSDLAPGGLPLMLASLGGSAVFLFGLTRAPAAQPRALFGGHLGGALIGIAFFQLFGDALWVYAAAQAVTLLYMLLARTVHPPAGANPVIMIHGHAGLLALWQPVLVGVGTLFLVAVVWSRLYPGLCRYPLNWNEPSPPRTLWGGWDN